MSGMSEEDGSGGEITVLTVNYLHPVIKGRGVGTEVRTEERHKAGFGFVSVHIHDASGLCHKGSGFGMRRVGYGE